MTSKSGDERGVGAVVVHYFREADLEGMMVNLIERHKIRPQDLVVVGYELGDRSKLHQEGRGLGFASSCLAYCCLKFGLKRLLLKGKRRSWPG